MRQIEQIIPTINEVDIAVVPVRPSVRPCINDLEIVATVRKMRATAYDRHVPDREMMVMPEMSTKVRVIDSPTLLRMFVMPLFVLRFLVPRLIVMIVSMFILSKSSRRAAEQKC
jgi:hypothetical protein